MPDPVTDNYSIVLPTVGGDSGTWGGIQNNGIFSPVDAILGANLPVTINASDVNLTTTQFQNAIFVLTGVLTADRSLIIPLSPNSATLACGGRLVVVNNTTGNFNVTVKTIAAGSTGVVVPQGFTAFLYSDKTNVGYASNGLPGFAKAIAGTPNGTLGGTAGSVNTNASLAYDYTNNILYVCTTSGAAGVAVWSTPGISALVQWITAGRPVAPAAGAIGFNTTLALMEYWTGTDGRWAQPSLAAPPAGSFSGLAIKVTSNTTLTVAANSLVVSNGADNQLVVPNHTINMATTGANGLDTGAIAAATWYAIFEIAKPDGTSGALASLSATAPTMPAGYTYKARIGWVRTAVGVAQLLGTWQLGDRAVYKLGLAQTTVLPLIGSGTAGTYNNLAPTWASVSITPYFPSTASLAIFMQASNYNNGTQSTMQIAANTNYAGYLSTKPPQFDNAGVAFGATVVPIVLEGSTIAWTSSNTGGALMAYGWDDNL